MTRYLLGDKQRAARRQQLRLLRLERTFRPMVQAEIARASGVMIGQFAAGGTVRGDDRHAAEMEAILRRVYAGAVEAMGGDVLAAAKAAGRPVERKDFSAHFARMAQEFFAAWGAQKVVQVSDTTKAIVARAIARGYRDGLGQAGVADLIRGLVPQTYPARAEVIARTETHAAASYGAQEAAKETGLPLRREWVAAVGERTRETHQAANGQIVGMDEPFQVGGASLAYPGDPAGPPEEVINCRCIAAYVVDD